MFQGNAFHRSALGRLSLVYLLLLVVAITPVVVHGAGSDVAITVTSTVAVERLTGVDEIVLASLVTAEDAEAPVALGVQWTQDTGSWFPTWKLQLTSASALLPSGLPTRAAGKDPEVMAIELGSVHPVQGHTYETTLSYSASLGALAIKVYDVTDERLIYTDGFGVPEHKGPLYALSGTTVAEYLPIGTTWTPGVREGEATFLALGQFSTRSENAAIRITVPAPAPGEYRVALEHGDAEQHIATLRAKDKENWIPLTLDDVPLGRSALRLDYVVDGEVLLSDKRTIVLGRVDFWMDPVTPLRDEGTLQAVLKVHGAEAISEDVTTAVTASVFELVWDAERREFDEVLFEKNTTLFAGAIDLSIGTTQLPLEVQLPERPANWKVVVSADIEPKMASAIGGNTRLFSTHLPAQVGPDEPYTIVVLPDTQYFARSYPDIYTRMTDWITANALDKSIAAILHVGDITDNDTPAQWERAFTSMSLLHGVVPYVVTLGNHDMTNGRGGQVSQRGLTLLNNYFTAEDAKLYSNLGGTMVPDRLENHYSLFNIGGTDYLVIALEFGPPDEAVAWANEIAAQYPDHRMILLTHSYTATSGNRSRSPEGYELFRNPDTTVNSGPEMWSKFVRRHANSFMVVSGHTSPPLTVAHNVALASTGQPVFELLFDYQNQDMGGNGWMGLMTFLPDNTVDVRIFSPYLDEYANEQDSRGFTSRVELHLDTGLIRRLRN